MLFFMKYVIMVSGYLFEKIFDTLGIRNNQNNGGLFNEFKMDKKNSAYFDFVSAYVLHRVQWKREFRGYVVK